MSKLIEIPLGSNPRTNLFLARLGTDDYDALMRKGKIVVLKFRKRLILQDEIPSAVYFPLTAMLSLLVTSNSQPKMELATIGSEGVVGASTAMIGRGAIGLHLVQIPGTAFKIDAQAFRTIASTRQNLQRLVEEHTYALMRQILYGASCNHIHSMEERCARWLLMTHDRAKEDTFPLTQEFLSHMLGVRRATVNVALGILKKAGFIQYVRGKLTILDRPGLESAACECYEAIRQVYNRMSPAVRLQR